MKFTLTASISLIVLGLVLIISYVVANWQDTPVPHPLPVAVFHGFAPDGSGQILQVRNNSRNEMILEITFTSAKSKAMRTVNLSLQPGKLEEVGHGLNLEVGDTAQITADGFDPLDTGL